MTRKKSAGRRPIARRLRSELAHRMLHRLTERNSVDTSDLKKKVTYDPDDIVIFAVTRTTMVIHEWMTPVSDGTIQDAAIAGVVMRSRQI